MDLLKILIPAVLALAGTIAGIVFAQRRWSAERASAKSADFARERREAYKQLWALLEETHMKIRGALDLPQDWHGMLAALNAFILKADVYLEPDIHQLANDYVDGLRHLRETIDKYGSEVESIGFADSRAASPALTYTATAIRDAAQLSERLRNELKQRVVAVLK